MIDEEEKLLYENYTKWAISKGAKFDKIDLTCFYTDYRGLVANSNIKKGEIILFIPDNSIITLKMAKEAHIGKKIIENDANLIYKNNSTFSTYVLWEMANPKTRWKLFFKSLPKSVASFPVFFTEEEKKLLTGSHFLKAIDELKEDMKWDYDKICEAAPEFQKVASLEDFMRIRELINSRIFGTKIGEIGRASCRERVSSRV